MRHKKLVRKVADVDGCLEALDQIFIKTGDGDTNVTQEGSVNS